MCFRRKFALSSYCISYGAAVVYSTLYENNGYVIFRIYLCILVVTVGFLFCCLFVCYGWFFWCVCVCVCVCVVIVVEMIVVYNYVILNLSLRR